MVSAESEGQNSPSILVAFNPESILELSGKPFLKYQCLALAGVAQWIECQPVNQGVACSIPSQGTCLGCGPGPWWGVHERQPHTDVSLSFSFPSPLKINKF